MGLNKVSLSMNLQLVSWCVRRCLRALGPVAVSVAVGAAALACGKAQAQVTYDSQLRTLSVSTPVGGSQSAFAPPGDFNPFVTSVTSGFAPATNTVGIQSLLQPSGVALALNVNCQTAGTPPSTPAAVVQHQVTFTLSGPRSYLLTAGDGLPLGANVGLNTSLVGPGGVTVFSGRETPAVGVSGTLPAGTYTFSTLMQITVAGGALGPAVGTVSVSLTLLPANDTGTSILYQGRLTQSGAPANGQFDMTFQVFDAPTGGNALSGVISVPRVQVTDGLFSTLVDIPPSVWNAGRSYIECAVGFPVTFPTVLSPRQPVQPAPKALWALIADGVPWSGILGVPPEVSSPPWSIVSGGVSYTGGNVGIGVAVPGAPLHVSAGPSGVAPQGGVLAAFEGSAGGYVALLGPNGSETGVLFGRPATGTAGAGIIYNNPGTPGGLQFRTDPNTTRMTIASNGAAAFTGTVTAPNFVYAAPVTTNSMVSYYGFRARNGAPVRNLNANGEGAGFDAGTAGEQLTALLDIPSGATLTNLRVFFLDNSGADLGVVLFAYQPAVPTNFLVGSGGSSGQLAGTRFIDIPLSYTVDNANFALHLAVSSSTNVWDNGLQVRGVRATYTVPRPVP